MMSPVTNDLFILRLLLLPHLPALTLEGQLQFGGPRDHPAA